MSFVLIIVLLGSNVTLVSEHASADVCESLAQRAREMRSGMQAVASAHCEARGARPQARVGMPSSSIEWASLVGPVVFARSASFA